MPYSLSAIDLVLVLLSVLISALCSGLEIAYVIRVLVDRRLRSDAAIERPVAIV